MDKPYILNLMGPTASGKTHLAMLLFNNLPVDIISVDSAQVYRGLDIGSAKPSKDILAQYPHQLIDICDPTDSYSVEKFRQDAWKAITKSHQSGRIPLLVGGSMLYFKALKEGLSDLPISDKDFFYTITQQAQTLGWDYFHKKLEKIDPISAARIHVNDSQRLIRALEVYEKTGKSLSQLHAQKNKLVDKSHNWLECIILPEDRSVLHQRIARRFRQMIDDGLVQEVDVLFNRGDLDSSYPAIRSVGYQQVWSYLQGKINHEEMIERGIIATRQMAKRQLTWLRHWPDLSSHYLINMKSLETKQGQMQIIGHIIGKIKV